MRYLILSDIHGNRFGLEGVLQDAGGSYDQVLCLGDVVGYGAHPNKCCEILRDIGAVTLLGNHDVAALGYLDAEHFNELAKTAIQWTQEQLTRENWVWLNHLEPYRNSPEHRFEATHGSLREPFYEEYILGIRDADDTLQLMSHAVCFFGHTHRAGYFHCPDPLQPQDDVEWVGLPGGGPVEIKPAGSKYLINPGSCGQPRDGNPQARYAIYDTDGRNVVIRAVNYDVQSARDAIIAARLPLPLADRLLAGQ